MGRLASRSGRIRQGLTGAGFAAAVGVCALISWAASGPPKLAHADVKAPAAPSAVAADNADAQLQPVNSTKALKAAEISVVRVLVVYRGFGGTPLDTVSMGSGFVVAPGYIVTNYHVVEVPPEASSADIYIVPHKDSGANYQPVRLVKSWTEGDLALLQAPDLKIPPLKLYLSPYKNERVVSMGYPDVTDHLLNRAGTELLQPTDAYVTQGSIALFASTNPDGSRVDTLFHTAPINHGNSGGPLLNECGQVVGVNTWTAPSTVSAGGDVNVSAGQFVATHVSALNTFLSSAGVTPQVVSQPCYARTEDEIVKDDELTKALAAAASAQEQRLQDQKQAEADRAAMERWQLAAMVLLSLLVLILIGLIIRREIRHRTEIHAAKEPDAPTAFDSAAPAPGKKADKPAKAAPAKVASAPASRPKHPIPWGWILLGLIIVIAVAAFVIKDHDIARRLGHKADAATVDPASVATAHLVCEVDRAHSPKPLTGAGPIEFDFDAAHACVNGRTPYERQADGTLLRFTVNDTDPMAAKMELATDGSTFKRSDYRLSDDQHKSYLAQRNALGTLRCSAGASAGAVAALADNLARVHALSQGFLTSEPETQTVWHCHR
jgi:S1-C subfamily serine protease